MGIPLLLIFAIMVYFMLPWFLMYIGIQSEPDPPRPQITYGEFPFRLEYEINGQRKVIKDTLICEYDGISSNEGRGKYRKWKQTLSSGSERITLLKVDNTKEIYYAPGSAEYYMGDIDNTEDYNHQFPNAVIVEREGKMTNSGLIRADQLLEQYSIKLISWDYTEPIKNEFSSSQE